MMRQLILLALSMMLTGCAAPSPSPMPATVSPVPLNTEQPTVSATSTATPTAAPTLTPGPTATPQVWNPSIAGFATLIGSIPDNSGIYTDDVSIYSFAFTSDSHYVYAGEFGAAIRQWNVSTQELVTTLAEASDTKNVDRIEALALNPDNSLLASADSKEITIWALPAYQKVFTFAHDVGAITRLIFTPDGKSLLSTSHSGVIKLLNVNTGTEIFTLRTPLSRGGVYGAASINNGQFVTVSGQTIRFWSWRTGDALGVLWRTDIDTQVQSLLDVKYNDRTKLAAIMDVWHIQLWDASGDQWQKLYEFEPEHGGFEAMDFDPSGRLLAFAHSVGVMNIMDTKTGEILANFGSTGGNISQITFSPDGRLLAVADGKGAVQLWGINSDH